MQIVGIMLVRNEDVFVERVVRNVIAFCDRIHVVDHRSSDRTPVVLRALAAEFDHLEVRRARRARVSHELLEPYVGTNTWALRVDGDEVYDPAGLTLLRRRLLEGDFRPFFRVQANVLHCVSLDAENGVASGYLSPPSRPITALFNLAALDRWTNAPERLHAGTPEFRDGYGWDAVKPLADLMSWDESPLRYLHVCFLPRSSEDGSDERVRRSLGETGLYDRSVRGSLTRTARGRRLDPLVVEIQARGSNWKLEKYRRGPLVTKDVSSFLA